MTFDFEKILKSKREYRQRLAAMPIEEKLSMLDALRERSLALRSVSAENESGVLRENPTPYRTENKSP